MAILSALALLLQSQNVGTYALFNLDIITYLTPAKRAMGAVKPYEHTIKPLEANEFYKDP